MVCLKVVKKNYSHSVTHSKTIEQIEKAPRNDDIVVQSHKQSDNARGNSYAAQPRMYCVPYAQRTESHFLANAQFDKKQRYAFEYQHDHERYQKSTCTINK